MRRIQQVARRQRSSTVRRVKRTLTTLPLLLALNAVTSVAYAAWILPPEASSAVTRAVDIMPKADRAGLLRSATLDKSTIRVQARRGDTVVLAVTLVHPSVAPTGAFQAAGVALIEGPGPLNRKALADLKRSLTRATDAIPWRELAGEVPELAPEAMTAMTATLRHAQYLRAAGDLNDARTELERLPSALPPHVAVRAAVLWTQLDAPKAAAVVLTGLGDGASVHDAAAKAIQGQPVDAEALLDELSPEAACHFTELAAALVALQRPKEAREVAEAVLRRAPDCQAAWESALHRRLEARDFPAALTLAEAALAKYELSKASDGLISTIASAHVAVESYVLAAELLELVARRTPTDESVVRVLLSAMLRDADVRAAHTLRLERQHAEAPDDIISTFLLGIIYHYANRFDESTSLLAPLEASLGHQGRLHIYLAMNDFNVGKIQPALERLDAAALRRDPDPDIFYCRAEILRDTRRKQARDDLARYDSMSRGSHMSNPEKNARVGQMISDLEGCLKDNPAICESLWEHPRLRKREAAQPSGSEVQADDPGDNPWWPKAAAGGLALMLLLAFAGVVRGRTKP
jgi:tetratricopeptide (TPR) repeat protein